MKKSLLVLVAVFLFSCGATVNYDYDSQTDFRQYVTYNYYPDIDSGLSELDDKRIAGILDQMLRTRGFGKTAEDPDFIINFFAKETMAESGSTIGIGVGGGGRNVGGGISGGIPIGGTVIHQELTIDFIDSAQDRLIWQAEATGKFKLKSSPDQKRNYYLKVLEKVMKGFPPK